MIEKLIVMWFYIIFFILIPLIYKALMALDFSNLFKRSSTWQIKFLMIIVSIVFAYIVASAIEMFFIRFSSLF